MNWLSRILTPSVPLPEERRMISDTFLREMIIPLFIEQLLVMVVGLADTMMVSHAGEAVVSGVSLDTMIYTIFLYIFGAIASGGAVVVSQYLGNRSEEDAAKAAGRMLSVGIIASILCTALMLAFYKPLLAFLYPDVEPAVMEAAIIYLRIVILSFPANAIYNAGAALCRSLGKTRLTMEVSLAMNLVNVAGNAIGIFVLHAGAAGVAWPTTLSWYFAAVVMTAICASPRQSVRFHAGTVVRPDRVMDGRILRIAVPNALENGLFQLSKVVLGSLIATFGTSQIAANGIGQTIWSLAATVMVALSPVFITVIGQCMGAGDAEAAEYYMRKLIRIGILASTVWNILVLLFLPAILPLYAVSEETKRLIVIIVILHNIFCALVSTMSGPLSAGLRAAGDVRFTLFASIFSTVICRVALSFLFCLVFRMGVIGITVAMVLDWCIRAFLQMKRLSGGKWKTQKVI